MNVLNYKISELNSLKPDSGRILLAEPFMKDPYFKRSVVLLVEHNSSGSIGFILNKPMKIKLNDALHDFPEFNVPVYMGGPVDPDKLHFIHSIPDIEDSFQITKNLFWGGHFEQIKEMVSANKISEWQIKFFIGYSGWTEEQLQNEIKEDSWLITKVNNEAVFQTPTKNLWSQELAKMGKMQSIMANFPEDPVLN